MFTFFLACPMFPENSKQLNIRSTVNSLSECSSACGLGFSSELLRVVQALKGGHWLNGCLNLCWCGGGRGFMVAVKGSWPCTSIHAAAGWLWHPLRCWRTVADHSLGVHHRSPLHTPFHRPAMSLHCRFFLPDLMTNLQNRLRCCLLG